MVTYCCCCRADGSSLNIKSSFDVHNRLQAPPLPLQDVSSRKSAIIKPGVLLSRGLNQNMIWHRLHRRGFLSLNEPAFGVACVGSEARLCNAHRPLTSCCPLICCYSGDHFSAQLGEGQNELFLTPDNVLPPALLMWALLSFLYVVRQEGGRKSVSVGVLEHSDG